MAKQSFSVGQVLTAAQMTSLQQTAMGGGSPVTKTSSYVLTAADAGTVIQVNSTSATTITVNTGLFSAGDSVQIQNIGSGTCTITAGTATVNSAGSLGVTQYDGGFLYFSSASSAIWFDYTQPGTTLPLTTKGDLFGYDTGNARVPIGANDTVLTADSTQTLGLKWATPVAGGITLLSTTTLSGASTTISSISGAYTNLQVMIYGMTNNTNTQDLLIGFNGTTTGNEFVTTDGTNQPTLTLYTNQRIQPWRLLRTDANNVFQLNIYNYSSSTFYKAFTASGTGLNDSSVKRPFLLSGGYQSNSAITSITISNNGGTWATGTVLIYGVK